MSILSLISWRLEQDAGRGRMCILLEVEVSQSWHGRVDWGLMYRGFANYVDQRAASLMSGKADEIL